MYVTIDKRFVIGLNKNHVPASGQTDRGVLALQPQERRDRCRAAGQSAGLPAAFPVREKPGGGFRINASPFCKHFGIRIDTTERFIHPDIRDGKLLLKLYETVTIQQPKAKNEIPRPGKALALILK
jgi:hypothetical protein